MGKVLDVPKGWGKEIIFAQEANYCGKLLCFNKGARFSMHFHKEKDESWYVLDGTFDLLTINTKDASVQKSKLSKGDVWRNEPLLPHQLICLEKGTIIEVSTPDSVEDNFRIGKGDSQ